MEFRLRNVIAIITILSITICSCSKLNCDSETNPITIDTSDGVCSSETYSDIYSGDILLKEPNMSLSDGFYLVRIYVDEDYFVNIGNNLYMTVGVMNNRTRYYTQDEIESYSVGDIFIVDEDLNFIIESLDVEKDIYINGRYYNEEIIRLNSNYVLRHPSNNDDDYYYTQDLWTLNYVRSFDGESDVQTNLLGIADICIAYDCLLGFVNYDVNTGLGVNHPLYFTELTNYIMAQDDIYETSIVIYAYIWIENEVVVEMNFSPYSYDGRVICLEN